MRHPSLGRLLAPLLVPFLVPVAHGGDPSPQPNVIVIVADDLGNDMLVSYDEAGDFPDTLNVNLLALEGVSFRNVWSNPLCSPTRATLLTGRYGFRTTVGSLVTPASGGTDLPRCEVLLPELLCAQGYRTAAIGKWHLTDGAYPSCAMTVPGVWTGPVEHGFEYFAGSLYNLNPPSQDYFDWARIEHTSGSAPQLTQMMMVYAPERNVDDALAWIGQLEEEDPFFLYLAFNSPHVPLQVPPDGQFVQPVPPLPPAMTIVPGSADPVLRRQVYKAMIESMDYQIGRLLANLSPARRDNTWVVFVGDNGTTESLTYAELLAAQPGACNSVLPPDLSASPPNKGALFEGGINVPLIVSGPPGQGWVDDPRRFKGGLVNTTDVFATVCEMTGTPLPGGVVLDSLSVLPVVLDRSNSLARDFAYAERFSDPSSMPGEKEGVAIRNDRFKYVHLPNDPVQQDWYFDLQNDPCELDNLWLAIPYLTALQRNNLASLLNTLAGLTATPAACDTTVDPCSVPSCP